MSKNGRAKPRWRWWFAIACLFGLGAGVHAEPGLLLSIGGEYSAGKFGTTTRTSIWYVPLTAAYSRGRFSGDVTIPYLRITNVGDGVLVSGGRNPFLVTRQATRKTTTTQSGLGDIETSLGYAVIQDDQRGWYVTPRGKVKFGTASASRGLGTGENDYALQLDLAKVTLPWTVYGFAGYGFIGDPVGVNLNNVPYGQLGVERSLSEVYSIGLHGDVAGRLSDNLPIEVEMTGYLTGKLNSGSSYTFYVRKGFSSSVADWGAGLTMTFAMQ